MLYAKSCIPQLNGFFTTSESFWGHFGVIPGSLRGHLHHSCPVDSLNSKRPSHSAECEGLGLTQFTARLELLAGLDKVLDLRANGV